MCLVWSQFEQTSLGVHFFCHFFLPLGSIQPSHRSKRRHKPKQLHQRWVESESGNWFLFIVLRVAGVGARTNLQFSMRIGSWSYSFLKSFEITWFPENSRRESPHVNTWGYLLMVQEEEGKDEAEEEESGRDGVKRILKEVNFWCIQISKSWMLSKFSTKPKKEPRAWRWSFFFFLNFGSGNTSLKTMSFSWVPAAYDCETEGGSDEGSSWCLAVTVSLSARWRLRIRILWTMNHKWREI